MYLARISNIYSSVFSRKRSTKSPQFYTFFLWLTHEVFHEKYRKSSGTGMERKARRSTLAGRKELPADRVFVKGMRRGENGRSERLDLSRWTNLNGSGIACAISGHRLNPGYVIRSRDRRSIYLGRGALQLSSSIIYRSEYPGYF